MLHTVPIRSNLTGNVFVNGNGTDTERVQERKWNGYRKGTEQIQNGYRTEMEQIQKSFESQKCKKAFKRTQTIRQHVLQNTRQGYTIKVRLLLAFLHRWR